MKKKIAVVLFNLGGPDKLSSVKEFLFNLFYDPAIIHLPNPFRYLLAKFISSRREKKSQNIYKQIGGKSPILELTLDQADKLKKELNQNYQDKEYEVFTIMRYWHPFAKDIITEIQKFQPDNIILLPLYPQFSTTTSESSIEEFMDIWKSINEDVNKIKTICCYFDNQKFIDSHVQLIKDAISKTEEPIRILFSAHGLPEKIIKNGDPYQYQVEKTVALIMKKIGNYDFKICYQSKVGPMKWLEPATEDELIKAAHEKLNLVLIPIAFVSEHSETLVELDIEYQDLYKEHQGGDYVRVPALNSDFLFISSLAEEVENALSSEVCNTKCPMQFAKCFKRG